MEANGDGDVAAAVQVQIKLEPADDYEIWPGRPGAVNFSSGNMKQEFNDCEIGCKNQEQEQNSPSNIATAKPNNIDKTLSRSVRNHNGDASGTSALAYVVEDGRTLTGRDSHELAAAAEKSCERKVPSNTGDPGTTYANKHKPASKSAADLHDSTNPATSATNGPTFVKPNEKLNDKHNGNGTDDMAVKPAQKRKMVAHVEADLALTEESDQSDDEDLNPSERMALNGSESELNKCMGARLELVRVSKLLGEKRKVKLTGQLCDLLAQLKGPGLDLILKPEWFEQRTEEVTVEAPPLLVPEEVTPDPVVLAFNKSGSESPELTMPKLIPAPSCGESFVKSKIQSMKVVKPKPHLIEMPRNLKQNANSSQKSPGVPRNSQKQENLTHTQDSCASNEDQLKPKPMSRYGRLIKPKPLDEDFVPDLSPLPSASVQINAYATNAKINGVLDRRMSKESLISSHKPSPSLPSSKLQSVSKLKPPAVIPASKEKSGQQQEIPIKRGLQNLKDQRRHSLSNIHSHQKLSKRASLPLQGKADTDDVKPSKVAKYDSSPAVATLKTEQSIRDKSQNPILSKTTMKLVETKPKSKIILELRHSEKMSALSKIPGNHKPVQNGSKGTLKSELQKQPSKLQDIKPTVIKQEGQDIFRDHKIRPKKAEPVNEGKKSSLELEISPSKVPTMKIHRGGVNKNEFKVVPQESLSPEIGKTFQEDSTVKLALKPDRKMFPELEIKIPQGKTNQNRARESAEVVPASPAAEQEIPTGSELEERRSLRPRRNTLNKDADQSHSASNQAPSAPMPAVTSFSSTPCNQTTTSNAQESQQKNVQKTPLKVAHKSETKTKAAANVNKINGDKNVQGSRKHIATGNKTVYRGNQVQVRLRRLSPRVGHLAANKSSKSKVTEIIAGRRLNSGINAQQRAKPKHHGKGTKVNGPNSPQAPESRTVQLPGTNLQLTGVVVKPNGLCHEEPNQFPPVVCLEKTLIKDKIYMIAQENGSVKLMYFDGLLFQPLYHDFFAAAAAVQAAANGQMEPETELSSAVNESEQE